jgi:hypothetical protein
MPEESILSAMFEMATRTNLIKKSLSLPHRFTAASSNLPFADVFSPSLKQVRAAASRRNDFRCFPDR